MWEGLRLTQIKFQRWTFAATLVEGILEMVWRYQHTDVFTQLGLIFYIGAQDALFEYRRNLPISSKSMKARQRMLAQMSRCRALRSTWSLWLLWQWMEDTCADIVRTVKINPSKWRESSNIRPSKWKHIIILKWLFCSLNSKTAVSFHFEGTNAWK